MAGIKEFARFFRNYLDLCLSPNWPVNDNNPEELIKALEVAHNVEISVKKMKTQHCFDKFLELLRVDQNFTDIFLQNCVTDPPKCILKKIINSDAQVTVIDIAFERFEDLYSEDRLVKTLSELMVEAASKETLLSNMSTMLPAHKVQELRHHLHLFVIMECDNEMLPTILKDCCQEMMNALVLCLRNDNLLGFKKDNLELVRRKIITGFTNVMTSRDSSVKIFWENLINVDKENLVEMCLKYNALAEMVIEALGDNCMQIINNSPVECCYIQFSESELYSKCNTIFKESVMLKHKFMKYMKNNGYSENCFPFCKHKVDTFN